MMDTYTRQTWTWKNSLTRSAGVNWLLAQYIRGWVNYFALADMKQLLKGMQVQSTGMEGTRNGKLPQRNMESGNHAEQCTDKQRNSQPWIYVYG